MKSAKVRTQPDSPPDPAKSGHGVDRSIHTRTIYSSAHQHHSTESIIRCDVVPSLAVGAVAPGPGRTGRHTPV